MAHAISLLCFDRNLQMGTTEKQNEVYLEPEYAADLASIRKARKRIETFIDTTPVLKSSFIDELSGRKLFFKAENFQKGGAFKIRGACNAVFSLPDEVAKRGILTHSSGNHAAAVALAAKLRDIPAHIVIPKNAPQCKIDNVNQYGGRIVWADSSIESREAIAAKVQEETGAVMIHPFNDGNVISGQGTIALEFLEQVPELEAIVVPISGGGLISGIALGAKGIKPTIKIFGAEPYGASDAAQSKATNTIVRNVSPRTLADGLRAQLGDLTWPVIRDLVDDIIVVNDKDIVKGMKMLYESLKIVVEPSGAIGLAAVLSKQSASHPDVAECRSIGIVLSGGNVDLDPLWDYMNCACQT
ncbi:hypothetical protein O6H91_11G096700 [Diphasiastrum complanatum]|uniref:Uncharacterized protein n=2 Tax=Diphasiastrum complanatum TaxID=34168 RepID=A0ACC2CBU5_DIPCM|nr:hypothetical protein O6H91_Y235000 [Diphasiastrum complanatum]KAJ7539502.1 hypothetical protein O6H91_11G096700 [Diphasiastrum complanatum]